MMRGALALLSLKIAFVLAQDRCDAAKTVVKCDQVPDIMGLETSNCQKYHLFVARGTDERPPGRQGNVTRLICEALGKEDCGFENIDYSAKSRFVGDYAWCLSASTGAKNGQTQLEKYAQRCPDSKLILLGYSQGASITQDMLGGGGGHVFKCEQASNPALDRSKAPGANVAAAVTFGTVVKSAGQDWVVGEGKDFNGTSPRTPEQIQSLSQYANVLRDYCDAGDPICAIGSQPSDLQNHLTYFEKYNDDIVQWVVKTVQKTDDKAKGSGQKGTEGAPGLSNAGKQHNPLLHQVAPQYWMAGSFFLLIALSWSVLCCYNPFRNKFSK